MPFASVRNDNGLSWAAMRPARLPRSIPAILFALLVLGAFGCSKKDGRLLGNERLLRGPNGFGTTTIDALLPDRDTYVSPGAANFSPTLLVGNDGVFESRAFFRVPAWSIPDTTAAGFAISSIFLEVPYDTFTATPFSLVLSFASASAYDSLAAFPGPSAVQSLGTADAGIVLPFRVPIANSTFTDIKSWAHDPASLPGLMLYTVGGTGITALRAGQARLRIGYDHIVSSASRRDTISTAIPLDFTLHTAGTPPPTGADTTLILGGKYDWRVPLHFAPVAVPSGSTVNEATLRLRVASSDAVFDASRGVDLEVRRVRNSWLESANSLAPLGADSSTVVTTKRIAWGGAADSVIIVTLPQSLIREWTAAGGVNEGLLLTLKSNNTLPELLLRSRESSNPCELRVSITTPPPGRF